MAPPGVKKKPGLVIAVGMKPGGMKPPGMGKDAPDDTPPDDSQEGKKHSVAEAHKVGAEEHCANCQHYQADSGECEEVEGYWDPQDACVKYFEAANGAEDEEEGGEGDNPAEEAAESAPPAGGAAA